MFSLYIIGVLAGFVLGLICGYRLGIDAERKEHSAAYREAAVYLSEEDHEQIKKMSRREQL